MCADTELFLSAHICESTVIPRADTHPVLLSVRVQAVVHGLDDASSAEWEHRDKRDAASRASRSWKSTQWLRFHDRRVMLVCHFLQNKSDISKMSTSQVFLLSGTKRISRTSRQISYCETFPCCLLSRMVVQFFDWSVNWSCEPVGHVR